MSYRALLAQDAFWRPSNQMSVMNTDLAKQLEATTLGARLWRLHPGQASTRHRHRETHELYVLLEGTGRVRVGQDLHTLEPLSALLVEPAEIRQLFNDTDADQLWLVVGAPPEPANTLEMTPEDLACIYPDGPKALPAEIETAPSANVDLGPMQARSSAPNLPGTRQDQPSDSIPTVTRRLEDQQLETAESSAARDARYDGFADWYIRHMGDTPGMICDRSWDLVNANLGGERWLDVACGAGRTARELGRRGASVVGVDISEDLISRARGTETSDPLGIEYVRADFTAVAAWWDGKRFDGAICEMAFMDLDDLDGTLRAVAAVLRPGGQFYASLLNPCFPGTETALSSWEPERGYASEGFWTAPDHRADGVRIRVGSNHRMLSTYLNALTTAGLRIEQAMEPPTTVPTWLVLACRRSDLPTP